MTAPEADPGPVLEFLRRTGLAAAGEAPRMRALAGGVSSDVWHVRLRRGAVCVKRALPRLRVAQHWEAPVERNLYERRWLELAGRIVPGRVPQVIAHDDTCMFAMQWLAPARHPVWKARLRDGHAAPGFAAEVGRTVARIHAATAGDPGIAQEFATDAGFHALRLEPYLLAAARAHPPLAPALEALVAQTAATHRALVHGDVSPKNILAGPDGPVLLDAECAWYGDPAFDPAFCLNHLLLKCLWTPRARDAFLDCFDALGNAYLERVDWEPRPAIEARIARLLPGLLLARVDGKSPVEYLEGEAQKNLVRRVAAGLLCDPESRLAGVRAAWRAALPA